MNHGRIFLQKHDCRRSSRARLKRKFIDRSIYRRIVNKLTLNYNIILLHGDIIFFKKIDVTNLKIKKKNQKKWQPTNSRAVFGMCGTRAVRIAYGYNKCLSVRKKPIARRRIVSGHCDRAARAAASGVSSNRDTGTCDGTRMSRSA